MTKIIKIRRHGFVGERTDNMLSEFQPIWSRAADLKLEMDVQLVYFFFLFSRNREKLKFRDYHTKGETAEESPFYITIGV